MFRKPIFRSCLSSRLIRGSRSSFWKLSIDRSCSCSFPRCIDQMLEKFQPETKAQIRRVTNVQICPVIGRTLNQRKLCENMDSMLKHAKFKFSVGHYQKGVFCDGWVSSLMVVFPNLLLVYNRKQLSSPNPLALPLYRWKLQGWRSIAVEAWMTRAKWEQASIFSSCFCKAAIGCFFFVRKWFAKAENCANLRKGVAFESKAKYDGVNAGRRLR